MAKKKTNNRRVVRVPKCELNGYDFDGPVKDIVDRLLALMKEHGDDLRITYFRDPWGDKGDSFDLATYRDENDDEYTARLATETAIATKQREQELKTLAELQAKYPGK